MLDALYYNGVTFIDPFLLGTISVQPFFEQYPLRFSCTQCGKCCMTAGDYYVYLTETESEAIRNHLQLSQGWFRRRYLARLTDGELVLASGDDDRCIFLDEAGQCRIYSARPLQCKSYPFWPELAGNARAWISEARRCEGINQGAVIPASTIRRQVQACRDNEG
jgi:Fe-S-cluster containining protein